MNWLYRKLIPNSLNAMPEMPMQSDYEWQIMVTQWAWRRRLERMLFKGIPSRWFVPREFSGIAELINLS